MILGNTTGGAITTALLFTSTVLTPVAASAQEPVDYFPSLHPQPAQHLVTGEYKEKLLELESFEIKVLPPPPPPVKEIPKTVSSNHSYDVEKAVALAYSEVGASRPTGWNQEGECIMSAKRWLSAGGANWTGSGSPVDNYLGATQVKLSEATAGDIIQYVYTASPTTWAAGVHTVLVTGTNDDGTLKIVESNNPGGSGLVSKNDEWTPTPPEGFEARVYRF